MNRFFLIGVIFVCGIFLSSCKDEIAGSDNEVFTRKIGNIGFTGTWVLNGNEDSLYVMVRSDSLAFDNYGFIINDSGTFIERKNIGWCGTPPIAYGNFEGTWEAISDSTLKINVGYWGGTTVYKIKIDFLTSNEMKYHVLY